ncbi:hypothetical protein DBR17_01680 [Sphingomonas sp. HMWF008]|nr:hypothetical protein DBR17_01680 [Sphingomonas sp. HMWF008]
MRDLAKLVGPLRDRIQAMVGRVVVSGVDDSTKLQSLQIGLLADETQDGVEHFQPYGFAAHPHADAEGLALAVGGLRGHSIVITVADRRYRMTALAQGEVALHDDQGQHVHLKRDGILVHGKKLDFTSDGAIEFTGTSFKVTSDQVELASDDVKLGIGATLQAARKTDAVSGGAISVGSAKVKIA